MLAILVQLAMLQFFKIKGKVNLIVILIEIGTE